MKLTRFSKAILYVVLAVVLLGVSLIIGLNMHRQGQLEENYFRSGSYLFLSAAILLGTGLYSLIAYTRKMREHRSDSLFLIVSGTLVMVFSMITMVLFGGMDAPFDETGYLAVNINLVAMVVLPALPLARALVLALTSREENTAKRHGVLIAVLLVAVATAVSVVVSGSFSFIHYEEQTQSYVEDNAQSDTGNRLLEDDGYGAYI